MPETCRLKWEAWVEEEAFISKISKKVEDQENAHTQAQP
jgi:hypothetical protein